uniref:Uncharacterized protein n=1 Tax=Cacopsylla melanoneura TaxID=428564 RepID=A0A8D9A647_9HEMI
MFLFHLFFIYFLSTIGCLLILHVWQHRRYYYLCFLIPGPSVLTLVRANIQVLMGTLETIPKLLDKMYNELRLLGPVFSVHGFGCRQYSTCQGTRKEKWKHVSNLEPLQRQLLPA